MSKTDQGSGETRQPAVEHQSTGERGETNALPARLHDGLVMHGAIGRIEIAGREYCSSVVERSVQHLGQLDAAMRVRRQTFACRDAQEHEILCWIVGQADAAPFHSGPHDMPTRDVAMSQAARPVHTGGQARSGADAKRCVWCRLRIDPRHETIEGVRSKLCRELIRQNRCGYELELSSHGLAMSTAFQMHSSQQFSSAREGASCVCHQRGVVGMMANH